LQRVSINPGSDDIFNEFQVMESSFREGFCFDGPLSYVSEIQICNKPVTAMAVCGNILAVGTFDSCVRIYNTFNMNLVCTFDRHLSAITAVCLLYCDSSEPGSGETLLCVSGSLDGTIFIWQMSYVDSPAHQDQQCKQRSMNAEHLKNIAVDCVQPSPVKGDNDGVWAGYRDGSICVWNSKSCALLNHFVGHCGSVTAMCAVLPEVGLGLTYIWTATRRI
jgi:WD40 repeat protein